METDPKKTRPIARAPKVLIVFHEATHEATLEFSEGTDPYYLKAVADALGLTRTPEG